FKFKKFKLERKGDHVLLYGEVNPWVLLANGRIKKVDDLEGKKAGISTQAEYDKIKSLKPSERREVYDNAVAKEDGKIDFDSIKEPHQKFTKEQLATKPKNSRDPKKWQDAGGSITVDENGVWTYINSEGVAVRYPGGYPDFTPYSHPTVEPVKIKIASPTNRPADYRAANLEAGLSKNSNPPIPALDEPPKGYVWHHVEDGETMILIDERVHQEFTHSGGISKVNGKNSGNR
ncbi:HNH endonuclease, partial [Paenibacillus sonchi]